MQGRWGMAVFLVLLAGGTAGAQEAYVSASLTGDVVRFSGSETAGVPDVSPDGEALGFALRIGTRLGSAWGVEAQFARPSRIEFEGRPDVIALQAGRVTLPGVDPLIFPPISYRVRTSYRDVLFSTGAWARQDLSARVALVYSGGLGFHRTERELEFTFDPIPLFPNVPGLSAIVPRASATKTTTYTARPFAGFDARIRMTDHVELVPGLRLHALDGGVLIRPAVGIGWVF